MDVFRRSLKFFRADSPRVLAALGLLLVNSGLALLKPWPLAWVVDSLTTKSEGGWPFPDLQGSSRLIALTSLIAVLYLANAVVGGLLQSVVISTGLRGLARVRRAVFDWLLGLSLRRLQGSQSGDLIYRATWDTYSFQTLFTQGLFVFLGASIGVVAMTLVMWRLNRPLTLVALATIPVLLTVMRSFGAQLSAKAGEAQAADSGIASQVQQTVASLPIIQSYTQEPRASVRFADQVATAFAARWRQHRLEVVYLAIVAGILALGTAGIVGVGASQVTRGALSVGELLVFLAYVTQLYEPLNQLSHLGATVSQAKAGAIRVLDLIEPAGGAQDPTLSNRERVDSKFPTNLPSERGWEVRFDRVCFGYSADREVLQQISFTVAPGEVVAILGPSGAGKTTLLHMIPRLLDPGSGEVLIRGIPSHAWPRTELRRQVAWVSQEPLLLPTTLAENIGFGREGASRAEIEAAARAAHADEFIRRLPHGYDTVVGDGAARLSVGEKQRINLARAFLKDAPILLLDEPTSALDSDSERAVLAGLRELMRGRTVLMVAHRLSTLREVQRIMVLEGGRMVETGTAQELVARGGYFARVWESHQEPRVRID